MCHPLAPVRRVCGGCARVVKGARGHRAPSRVTRVRYTCRVLCAAAPRLCLSAVWRTAPRTHALITILSQSHARMRANEVMRVMGGVLWSAGHGRDAATVGMLRYAVCCFPRDSTLSHTATTHRSWLSAMSALFASPPSSSQPCVTLCGCLGGCGGGVGCRGSLIWGVYMWGGTREE